MVGVVLFALIGMLGMVLDLSNLYVRKAELQNAADAAALAGARQLTGSATGLDAAVNGSSGAVVLAAANGSDFGTTAVAINETHIRFGTSPDGPWVDLATAKTSPAGMSYIKVDTNGIAQGRRPTWFMHLLNSAQDSTTTNGIAVAGAPICEGLPIFICPQPGGFVQGKAYSFGESPSVVGYFDPVTPGAPSLIPPGASEMSDIVCVGKTFCIGQGTYSSRTQAAFGKMEKAFNTRFGIYQGEFKDMAESCRPDTNVKEYRCDNTANCAKVDWMSTLPKTKLDIHWAASRPPVLPGVPAVGGNYPTATSGGGTPYTQTQGNYFAFPTNYAANQQSGRRIITVAIADPSACDSAGIKANFQGSGKSIPIKEYGRFFMQRTYDKGLIVEYVDTVPRLQASAPDIKLYR